MTNKAISSETVTLIKFQVVNLLHKIPVPFVMLAYKGAVSVGRSFNCSRAPKSHNLLLELGRGTFLVEISLFTVAW